ncbi:HlyD family efflux transporter periplasmic adaptor subunit [Lutibacter sp. HS1-25]|uniref:efflux RND transporter periplasmic adaptor subunit n=1 Tax=Lutibacter sp. HS1-25 TaxID=2485000 RepID=UPI00101190B6|nr:HlyD family efflux transporter periplasmic adaptor subunit [Lutibacter sp. HS1-25]RXP53067.1 HlyD family efflux transporter periplasmic adaptor subunit [Lutibacter sp. HS1-25]
MRKGITIVLAILLIAGSFLFAKYLIDNKQKPKPRANKIVKTVFTETVNNQLIPILITANGNLVAKNKIELFSEVQGVLIATSKEFKPGTTYKKGETIIKINSDEFYANFQAQKSNLFNVLTAIMPDIQLDFPNEYNKWENYLRNFNMNKPIETLPNINSEKEKFFISGRGVYLAYYNAKNLEVKLNKYTIKAPFNGVLTEAVVNPGTLIRSGQKLGEFIDPSVYEISASVKSEYRDLLQVGKTVEIFNLEKTQSWIGKVVRINAKVDTNTQTIEAFIQVNGTNLKEGQYLEVLLQAKSEENAYEVPRKLLIENSKLYVVKDSILDLITVNTVFENHNSVVIKGLENGTQLLSKPVPGSHPGMLVKVFNENTAE